MDFGPAQSPFGLNGEQGSYVDPRIAPLGGFVLDSQLPAPGQSLPYGVDLAVPLLDKSPARKDGPETPYERKVIERKGDTVIGRDPKTKRELVKTDTEEIVHEWF
jgi:hypothetical protein